MSQSLCKGSSILHGSWFSDSKMSQKKILKITNYWEARKTTDATIKEKLVYGGKPVQEFSSAVLLFDTNLSSFLQDKVQ